MNAPKARDIKRMIDLALDRTTPGVTVAVEAQGIKVTVRRDAPGESHRGSPDDEALETVRRSLGVAGPL